MKIVLLDAFLADQGGTEEWPGLENLGVTTRYERTGADAVKDRLQGATVAVINKVVIDEAVLSACPELKHVAVTATGTNVVDLEACKSRNVAVTNVPAYSTASVSQHVFALILDDASGVALHDERVRAGEWTHCDDFSFVARPTWELAGKHLAILGYGAIGSAVAAIAESFGMVVDVVGLPWRPQVEGRVSLENALARADVISLHCPLTPETQKLVNGDFLHRCKDDLLLINTGRGPLIDEQALADWLRANPRARAGVDVLSTEPPAAGNPLLNHPQVRITPHIAWATTQARTRLRTQVAQNILAWRDGDELNRVV